MDYTGLFSFISFHSDELIMGFICFFQVTTEDGYILSVQRIPQGREGGGGNNKQPVLLQHGVLVVSYIYIYIYH